MSNSISIGAAYLDQKIVGGSVDNSPIGATTASTGAFSTLSADTTVALGSAAAKTVGFYGKTPASQRASSVQISSNLATSTDFGATQLAWANEVTNTLVGLGIWKGAA